MIPQPTRPVEHPLTGNSNANNNLYDFEYDYTIPPPGSPPRPSALAIPNNIFGNTNGQLPETTSIPSFPRPNWVQRNFGSWLPDRFAPRQSRVMGSGLGNDGVFANVTAKPSTNTAPDPSHAEQGTSSVHIAPEFEQKDAPPTYADAQMDAVPPYWDTTVLAPAHSSDELIIEGLPPGHLLSFLTSLFISFSFQFIGFMLTSILAATHAAKFGSRAGLGMTLIQFGFYLRGNLRDGGYALANDVNGWPASQEPHPTFTSAQEADDYYASKGLNQKETPPGSSDVPSMANGDYMIPQEVTIATDWLSFFLMTVGWLLFLTSILGFYRIKRWERTVRQSSARPTEFSGQATSLRDGVSRDFRRLFARLPRTSEEHHNREGRNDADHNTHPSTLSQPPTEPPLDPEARRRYEAALQIDRQYVVTRSFAPSER
ncbi:hypothetical protein CPB86DRAFT_710956 [Serendipita vermifera]|nr:hypothetical protein CPB86DRAFT_710956 [Serendipita vermifera]